MADYLSFGFGKALDPLAEWRRTRVAMKPVDPLAEWRKTMEAMKPVNPLAEVQRASEAMKVVDPLAEWRKTMEAMKPVDPLAEWRKTFEAMKPVDPFVEWRKTFEAMKPVDPFAEWRKTFEAMKPVDPLAEWRRSMEATQKALNPWAEYQRIMNSFSSLTGGGFAATYSDLDAEAGEAASGEVALPIPSTELILALIAVAWTCAWLVANGMDAEALGSLFIDALSLAHYLQTRRF